MFEPRKALDAAGAQTSVVSPAKSKVTGWDLRHAGTEWTTDREVVVEQGLVTSRKPTGIPAFNEKMLQEFAEGLHGGQSDRTCA